MERLEFLVEVRWWINRDSWKGKREEQRRFISRQVEEILLLYQGEEQRRFMERHLDILTDQTLAFGRMAEKVTKLRSVYF